MSRGGPRPPGSPLDGSQPPPAPVVPSPLAPPPGTTFVPAARAAPAATASDGAVLDPAPTVSGASDGAPAASASVAAAHSASAATVSVDGGGAHTPAATVSVDGDGDGAHAPAATVSAEDGAHTPAATVSVTDDGAHAPPAIVFASDGAHTPAATVSATDAAHAPAATVFASDGAHTPAATVSATDAAHAPPEVVVPLVPHAAGALHAGRDVIGLAAHLAPLVDVTAALLEARGWAATSRRSGAGDARDGGAGAGGYRRAAQRARAAERARHAAIDALVAHALERLDQGPSGPLATADDVVGGRLAGPIGTAADVDGRRVADPLATPADVDGGCVRGPHAAAADVDGGCVRGPHATAADVDGGCVPGPLATAVAVAQGRVADPHAPPADVAGGRAASRGGPAAAGTPLPPAIAAALDEAAPSLDELAGVVDSLCDVRTRARRGVFYTAPADVDLVCRLALCEHLGAGLAAAARAALEGALFADTLADRATADAAVDALGLWPTLGATLERLTVLDPACGSGAFLVGMLRILRDLLARAGRPDGAASLVRDRLLGVEALPFAARLADARLRHETGARRTGVVVGDGLRRAPSHPARVDIVIGNPPYVRHERSAVGSNARRRRGRALDGPVPAQVDGRADLYVHFFVRSLARLAPGGALAFVASNAWLDAGYGAALRRLLARRYRLALVVEDEGRRWFAAAVNTTIVVAIARAPVSRDDGRALPSPDQRRAHAPTLVADGSKALPPRPDPPPALAVTRFVATDGPLDARRLAIARAASRPLEVDGLRVHPVAALDPALAWGGRYLRAPRIYHALVEGGALVDLGASPLVTLGRGHRTGRDAFFIVDDETARGFAIEPRFLRPLAASPLAFTDRPPLTSCLFDGSRPRRWLFACDAPLAALTGTGALAFIRHHAADRARGAPASSDGPRAWYALARPAPADLLLPVALHDRCFAVDNDARVEAHQRFATLTFHRRADAARYGAPLAALLSSSLTALFAEVHGRRAMGLGVLDLPPASWRTVPLPDLERVSPEDLDTLAAAWRALAGEPPRRLPIAVADPRRRALDRLALRLAGHSEDAVDELHAALLRLLALRLARREAPDPAHRSGGGS